MGLCRRNSFLPSPLLRLSPQAPRKVGFSLRCSSQVVSPGPRACRTQPLVPAVGLGQQPPTFEGPGAGLMEDSFSMRWGGDGFVMIQAHYLHYTLYFLLLLLHQLHLRSSGIRARRLGTPGLGNGCGARGPGQCRPVPQARGLVLHPLSSPTCMHSGLQPVPLSVQPDCTETRQIPAEGALVPEDGDFSFVLLNIYDSIINGFLKHWGKESSVSPRPSQFSRSFMTRSSLPG